MDATTMTQAIRRELKPRLRFPEFQDAGEWVEIKLIDVTNKKIKWSFIGGPFGSNLKSSDYVAHGIRIIQLQNIGDAQFHDDYKIFTTEQKADELLSCNIYPGEIILSKMGDPVGRACLIPNKHARYLMCSDGIRLVIDEQLFSKYFIYSLINSIYFRELVEKTATGSTRKRIGLDDLKNLPMVVPKLKEQQKIADCLSSIDDLITAQTQKLAALKTRKKGLMQQLFPAEDETLPKLRFPEFRDAPEWDLKPLDKICEIKGGKRIPKGFSLTNEKTDYPYVRVSDMYMGGIDTSSVLYVPSEIEKQIRNYKISKNDLFITVAGTIGIVGEVPEELDNANLTENANKIVLKSIGKKYLLHYLTGESAQQLISSSVTNNAQPKLALERIRLFPIPVPSPEEQQKIADSLSSIDELIIAQTQKLDTLKTHKKALMQQLFPAIDSKE